MSEFSLSTLDMVMVVIYIVGIVALGFWVARRTKTTEDYFLAGRSLTWPLIGLSLFASNISSSTLIGLAGSAYSTGIAVYNYEWFAVIVLVFFIIFFLPFYLKTRVYTMPEFLEKRYDARSRYYFSGIMIMGNILLETAGGLYAAALVIQLIYPDVPMLQVVTILAIVAGLYTAAGGLKAVVYTDAIQAVLLLLGSGAVAFMAYQQVGFSWEAVKAVTPPEALTIIMPLDDPVLPWLGLITGVPLLGIYFWCNNQFMVQRVLGSKTLDHGRWGGLLAGFLKVPVIFLMILPGVFARLLYPELDNADMVFPTLIFDLLPDGIRGIILIAMVAAIMSSIDSTLNAVSTLVTMDFVKKFRPHTSNERLVWVGRVTTVVVMFFAILWAPQIAKFPNLWTYLQEVLAYISPPIVALFMMGVFWKRANAQGAFAALMAGLVATIAYIVAFNINPDLKINFLYVATILFIICCVVLFVVSLRTAPPSKDIQDTLVWTRAIYDADTEMLKNVPWYQNYRVLSVLLIIFTIIVVGMWV